MDSVLSLPRFVDYTVQYAIPFRQLTSVLIRRTEMCVVVSIEVPMKMGCLLIVRLSHKFYFLCDRCERQYRINLGIPFRFVNFDHDQFPESFGQVCFTCTGVIKEGTISLFEKPGLEVEVLPEELRHI